MKHYEQYLAEGEEYLRASRPDLALPQLLRALDQVPAGVGRAHLNNTIARIRDLMGDKKEATARFLRTLEEPETGEAALGEQKAIALNNLGRLHLPQDPGGAIGHFNQSVAIYEALADGEAHFRPHLAHTYMARGEAHFLMEKYWYAKKDYKRALELHKMQGNVLQTDMLALAYYQLGAIYAEDYNAYDAKTNYQKAVECYREALEANPEKYRPLLAATLNNLAVVEIQLEEYDRALARYEETLEVYQLLSGEKPDIFEPYLAATYTNLGILLADHMKRYPGAFQANEAAISLYRGLSGRYPDRYTHYLATSFHNAGIYRLETEAWPDAAAYLSRALAIRKDLATAQGEAFGADYCATALNLLEYYQRKLEEHKELPFIRKGLDLIAETGAFLEQVPGSPAVENMKNDFSNFREFFNGVDAEEVRSLDVLQKLRVWEQDIDSTLDYSEKKDYQQMILGELRDFYREYPGNSLLRKHLVLALNNLAWLELCLGGVAQARQLLGEGLQSEWPLPALDCNLAHCDLLEGNMKDAVSRYRELLGKKNESNKDFREVIQKDLDTLESLGMLPLPLSELIDMVGAGPAKT